MVLKKVCLEQITYLSRLKLVFHAMLETLPFDFHRGEHQTVTDEVGRIADTFGRLKAIYGGK